MSDICCFRRAKALILFGLVAASACVAGAGEDDKTRVIDSWMERQKNTSSFLYETKGTSLTTKGSLSNNLPGLRGATIPATDHIADVARDYVVDLKRGWIRKVHKGEVFDATMNKFAKVSRTEFFDGQELKVGLPREQNDGRRDSDPDLWVKGKKSIMVLVDDLPVFFAHGIIPVNEFPQASRLSFPVASAKITHEGIGVVEQTECVHLRASTPAGKLDYWADPNKDGAILRATLPSFVTFDIKYQKTQWGWLPSGWRATFFGVGNTISNSEELAVTRIVVNSPLQREDFETLLQPKPGIVLGDSHDDKRYRVGPSGELTDMFPSRTGSTKRLLFFVLALVLASAVVIAVYRRALSRIHRKERGA